MPVKGPAAASAGRAFAPYPFVPERHRARLPPRSGGTEKTRHRVAIVGAGPVGYCAAIGLALQGVPSVLIEADDSVCDGSRAICVSRRSLEILARLGVLERFREIGLPWTAGRSFYRDREVLRFEMPHDENQRLPPMMNLAQYHIEQILLERTMQHSELIDLRWQTRLTDLDSGPDGVRLSLETPEGGYALEADWLIAADGGRSRVREALGLEMVGERYEGRYVIVDVRMRSARPTERLAFFDPPCNPGSTVLVHKQPEDVWRIDYQLRDGEDPEAAIDPRNVIPRVESLLEMIGEKSDWSPIWISLYRANALTLERYRHGRVLFAGDAAHLVPIFGVRGANSGIDDADNLAWKLAAVVEGRAHERLLDSYSEERVAAARENLRQGAKSTEFMAPPDFAFALMRDAVLSLAARHPSIRSLINPRQSAAVAYPQSRLHRAEAPGEFAAGPAPGTVLAECPVTIVADEGPGGSRSGFLTELLGSRFTLLWFAADPEADSPIAAVESALRARGVALRGFRILASPPTDARGGVPYVWDHTGRLWPMYAAAPRTAYLLRPDGHVLGRWRDPREGAIVAAVEWALQGGPER
ncbi:MAG: FAD-dependent oxidoreductase [Gammaproteobacteria bacterium]|nr:FAD-dependent oxidoreductase [Gammaproteobacteria bacterium]